MNYQATEIRTFDVDTFIENVFDKFSGTQYEESRETLQELWDKVLNMPPSGDKRLYPNANGPRPALLEVWLKAGDFWRAGYRLGDMLLCDQHALPLYGWMIKKIEAAKAAIIESTVVSTSANETTVIETAEITESAEAPAETTADDDTTTDEQTEEQTTNASTWRKGWVKDLCIGAFMLAGTVIVWECGLAIPFALLGGLAGGFLK